MKCLICHDDIVSKRAKMYCGTVCRNKGIANNRRSYKLEDSPTWKGGVKLDSTGYVLIKHPSSTRKDGYKQKHRVVIEEHYGREIRSDEDVHHINENKQDNELSNLSLMLKSVHMAYHAKINHKNRERTINGQYA